MRDYIFTGLCVLGMMFFLLNVVNDFLYQFSDDSMIYFVSIFVAVFFPALMRVQKKNQRS